MLDRLEALENRYESLNRELMDPQVQAQSALFQQKAKEHSDLEQVVGMVRRYKELMSHLAQAKEMAAGTDADMVAMAKEEIPGLETDIAALEAELQLQLLPKDPNDSRNVFLEIRAGTGGDEASLFAGVLLRMYTRWAESRGWGVEMASSSPGDVGGFKEAIVLIKGQNAWRLLKHEAGVHRVQRVPSTEAGGRIHTSTATVMVLPETEESEVVINAKDLKWDFFNSSGAGGQSVNTTYSAVRLTHLPTNTVVSMQDERSQLKNKEKAMKILASRIVAKQREREEAEASAARKEQVGTGDRSEKIRTYNYPQNRVTDHRVGLSVHNLPAVVEGDIDAFLDALMKDEQQRKLAELAPFNVALAQVDKPRPTVLELLQLAAGYLEKKGVASARREADALLGHVLEKDRLHLYLAFEERPSATEVDLFRALMKRRGDREPLQYLVGEGRFMGLRLKLDKRALIPRPETEALAQRLVKMLEPGGNGADIGTGSGCLALSLAAHGLDMQATDISADALALASENAALNGLEAKLRFAQGSLLEPIAGLLDLIVSNPPYIAEGTALQPEVGGFEPALALFGGVDGLSVLRPLLAQAPSKLKAGAWLALECGEGQPELLAGEAKASGAWSQVLIEEDPFGVPRFLFTRRT